MSTMSRRASCERRLKTMNSSIRLRTVGLVSLGPWVFGDGDYV
jgi:hypothetical protein